jgi:hypothetical protein
MTWSHICTFMAYLRTLAIGLFHRAPGHSLQYSSDKADSASAHPEPRILSNSWNDMIQAQLLLRLRFVNEASHFGHEAFALILCTVRRNHAYTTTGKSISYRG